MNSWTAKLEKWFAAVAFAEEGEHATAMKMVGLQPKAAAVREGVLERFNTAFAAVAFAEENCPEMAREILNPAKPMCGFAQ
jgi:truncated hemoglobin YjbI